MGLSRARQLFGDCSRVVPYASKALYLVSLLSSSARSDLDTYKLRMRRPISKVADMLGPAGQYVDPVFQHSRRHYSPRKNHTLTPTLKI